MLSGIRIIKMGEAAHIVNMEETEDVVYADRRFKVWFS